VPVNASLLPRTEEESERCRRTVYVTNIDLGAEVRGAGVHLERTLTVSCDLLSQPAEVSGFFETLCGPVAQLHLTRLDSQGTQVAFVEFSSAHAADRALSCGGARLKVRARVQLGRPRCCRRCPPAAACADGQYCGSAFHACLPTFAGSAHTRQPIQNATTAYTIRFGCYRWARWSSAPRYAAQQLWWSRFRVRQPGLVSCQRQYCVFNGDSPTWRPGLNVSADHVS
jgi:hypothetical protein